MLIDKIFYKKFNEFLSNNNFKFDYIDIGSSLPLNKYVNYLEKHFTIHLFEPNKIEAKKLNNKFLKKKNYIINSKAISLDNNSKVNIYDNKNMSSFLELNKIYHPFHPKCKIIKREKINSIPLEKYLKKNKKYILKVDAQGYSFECIKSAKDKIKNIPVIITELENYELYKNQKLSHSISDYLYKNDYIQIGNLGSYKKSLIKKNRKKNLYFREITYSNDVIFVKNFFGKKLDKNTCIIIIIFLIIFNFHDLAIYIIRKSKNLKYLLKNELEKIIKIKLKGNKIAIKKKYEDLIMKKISLKEFVENISWTNEKSIYYK